MNPIRTMLIAATLFASVGACSASAPSKVVSAAAGPILPVTSNPIANTSTVSALKIGTVLVENNVGPNGKGTSDHLEIPLTNTGATELKGFEVYYTFRDATASLTEGYYTKLPAAFAIARGATRVVHFDNSGAADHFPVSPLSVYATSKNALEISVQVSAVDAAVQTVSITKDAGGAEAAD